MEEQTKVQEQQEEYSEGYSIEELQNELSRTQDRKNFFQVLRNTIYTFIIAVAVAVILAIVILPILRITGSSMGDKLQEGDFSMAYSTKNYKPGQVIAFYYNNDILIKRVIAGPGDWVDIDANGNVKVNEEPLEEPYVQDKSLGKCNIEFPYQVPDHKIFVMGDNRTSSIDSRHSTVGCIDEANLLGRVFIRVWPFKRIGFIR